MTAATLALLFGSAVGAGIMNALAGGGTLLTFPALLLAGVPAIRANATSTVALVPGAAASLAGYRREVGAHSRWLTTLLIPSLLGGAIGSVLLLMTPEKIFERLAPWLVLFATLLFFFQILWARRRPEAHAPEPSSWALASVAQFFAAIYGGYFGAGVGIVMLVILGGLGLTDIHAMNGLKNFFGICINSVAALYFIVRGAVDWPLALLMTAGAILGGFVGANFARRIGKDKARVAVVAIGLGITIVLFLQRH
ncbi:MAG: sulfite exporter TauE/SafE family protein [Acidobacteria bacterium]|nr:sulfite exporter TauE/SafE family protein [Acidobacteriota bacterium]